MLSSSSSCVVVSVRLWLGAFQDAQLSLCLFAFGAPTASKLGMRRGSVRIVCPLLIRYFLYICILTCFPRRAHWSTNIHAHICVEKDAFSFLAKALQKAASYDGKVTAEALWLDEFGTTGSRYGTPSSRLHVTRQNSYPNFVETTNLPSMTRIVVLLQS